MISFEAEFPNRVLPGIFTVIDADDNHHTIGAEGMNHPPTANPIRTVSLQFAATVPYPLTQPAISLADTAEIQPGD